MLNRTLIEDALTARWAELNRPQAQELVERHEKHNIHIWRDVLANRKRPVDLTNTTQVGLPGRATRVPALQPNLSLRCSSRGVTTKGQTGNSSRTGPFATDSCGQPIPRPRSTHGHRPPSSPEQARRARLTIGPGRDRRPRVSASSDTHPTVAKTLLDVEAEHQAPLRSAAPRSGAWPQ
jgi:hypothetical protein